MNANELRIGNLVYSDKDYSEIISVCAKDFEDTSFLEPIPLTSVFLADTGFQFFNREWYIGEFGIRRVQSGFMWGLEFSIDYVHELQNFYFALYKKELEFKQMKRIKLNRGTARVEDNCPKEVINALNEMVDTAVLNSVCECGNNKHINISHCKDCVNEAYLYNA